MRFVLSMVMVAAFAVLAAAQVTTAPRVEARHGVLKGDVVRLGDVIVKVNGVEIRADEMEGTKAGREFSLRGNVRVMLPAPLTPSPRLRARVGVLDNDVVRPRADVMVVLDNDVVRLRGDVIVNVKGVEIRADEMEGTKGGREFTLRGNVRVIGNVLVTLPAPLTKPGA